jgi:hypothetical protein
MFLATINRPKQLLWMSFIETVGVAELEKAHAEVVSLFGELTNGFRLVTDLSQLDSMEVACTTEIARIMELCDQKGVGLVVRIIPDSTKDIGLNILTLFHYQKRPRVATCRNIAEAARLLAL